MREEAIININSTYKNEFLITYSITIVCISIFLSNRIL